MQPLTESIALQRRYSRSVNLERDLDAAESVLGYIPTSRAIDTLERFTKAFIVPHSVRAWTITGVYGTGKSAFAHFQSALFAPRSSEIKSHALAIARKFLDKRLIRDLQSMEVSERGLVRAVATGQREPIAYSLVRALNRGASLYWSGGRGARPAIVTRLAKLRGRVERGKVIANQEILDALVDLARASDSGVLLVLDELGKNLEYAVHDQSMDSIYLLQQIAELPSGRDDPKIMLLGILHQSFSDYAHGLTVVQRTEWSKVQGRFENISFAEAPEQVLRLIGEAIDKSHAGKLQGYLKVWSHAWESSLKEIDGMSGMSAEIAHSVYPLHPVSSILLPVLCNRFAQNDRSLFTFLTSAEPYSLARFISAEVFTDQQLPTLKPAHVFDYFVESLGSSIVSRPQFQHWSEIQGVINDARHLDQDSLLALKSIAIFNLASQSGMLRASRALVALSLCDDPRKKDEIAKWGKVVSQLDRKYGLVTWRRQIDELRIWQGSDFNVERAISNEVQKINIPLADLLTDARPLRPLVAQRHSYSTGTLRYFERKYAENSSQLHMLNCESPDSDGVICYWVGSRTDLDLVPPMTSDRKPLLIICPKSTDGLKSACMEVTALKRIESGAPQIQTDGVARREIRQRIMLGERLLDDLLTKAFTVSEEGTTCWAVGGLDSFSDGVSLNARLSDICDRTYTKGFRLWNELINRRDLSSQGARARRELIEAMIKHVDQEQLGLQGFGPDRAIYESLLRNTGLHRKNNENWEFADPDNGSGIRPVWDAISDFCRAATDSKSDLGVLYKQLSDPPFGVKNGPIPLLLAAFLLKNANEISLYMDGTFLPVLASEHFELLVRNPNRFGVKHIELKGIKAGIFSELEEIVRHPDPSRSTSVRNSTILGVVRPLIRFVSSLPPYTLATSRLSKEAIEFRRALIEAKEPDLLLFVDLPKAFGLSPNDADLSKTDKLANTLRSNLEVALRELKFCYDRLLDECTDLLCRAFLIKSDKSRLREDLRVRSTYILQSCIEPRLRSFLIACISDSFHDREWLESLLMIVADKPARSWSDADRTVFDMNLSEIARRFGNLEALQKQLEKSVGEGFDARRITITRPDGTEVNRLVWIDRENRTRIDDIVRLIVEDQALSSNEQLQQEVATALIELVLVHKEEVSEIPREPKKRKEAL